MLLRDPQPTNRKTHVELRLLMILMTDSCGNTHIFSEERIIRMARQQSLRTNIIGVDDALDCLNKNDRGEVYQLDSEYIEGITDGNAV